MARAILDERLNLPFDQYQRYRMVADVVERLREGPEPLQILDVSGDHSVLERFLPGERITVIELSEAEGPFGFAEGAASGLPFEDAAFDYVVSVDVHEHISPSARHRYLAELWRAAKKGVLLGGPFDSSVVREAERVADAFYRSIHLEQSAGLREHARNGLPRLDDTRGFFEAHDGTVSVLPNGHISYWLAMTCLELYSSAREDRQGELYERLTAYYNEFMYKVNNVEPSYRHLLISLKEPLHLDLGDLALPDSVAERASQSSAFFGGLSVVLALAAEIESSNARRHDYERRVARTEGALARKEAQVEDLSRRVAGLVHAVNSRQVHVTNLSKVNADLKVQRDRLEQQLAGVKQQLAGITNSRAWRFVTTVHALVLRARRLFGSS